MTVEQKREHLKFLNKNIFNLNVNIESTKKVYEEFNNQLDSLIKLYNDLKQEVDQFDEIELETAFNNNDINLPKCSPELLEFKGYSFK